jgi:hypothetical protein
VPTIYREGPYRSYCEVTNIGAHGFWLLVDDREYFVPFDDYPVFRQATVSQITGLIWMQTSNWGHWNTPSNFH